MRHPRLLPTAMIGLLCAVWFVDHRFMSAKIDTLAAKTETVRVQPVVAATHPPDVDADAAWQLGPKPDLIAKTLNDVTSSIPATQSKPALHRMKNVAVKAKPTSIDGLLN